MKTIPRGFTIIELLFIIVLLVAASVLFFVQKNNLEVAGKDETRKTAINAMYYSIEEVYFQANGYYPRSINEAILPSVEPSLFKDPTGVKIGESNSEYRYEAYNCTEDKCKNYTLRTTLDNEDDYIKKNRSN
ncbi:type II secretion system protein [Candidatus Saccharibacteria bacterium]|nr:type II secretion system protein [Candidatus Saccharibacteria bacterium]